MRHAILAAAAMVLVVTACAPGDATAGQHRIVGDVSVTFRIEPAQLELGDRVQFSIRLFNNSGRAKQLVFPSTQEYDFTVTRGGDEVWRWSQGRVFDQGRTTSTIPGQAAHAYSEWWQPDAIGTYTVTARVAAEGYERDLTGEFVVQ